MAAKKIRLHYEGGRVITELMDAFARANRTDMAGARQLIAGWVEAGDLVRRADGGFDVIRYRPRIHA